MSDIQTPATPTPRPLGLPNVTTGDPTTRADQAVAAARDLPDLIAKASALDPALAQKFTGQALLASRSPWGTLAGGVVAWLASRYGLGWDSATCDLVAGAGVLLGAFVMRWVTQLPVTGVFRAATVAETTAALPCTTTTATTTGTTTTGGAP